MVGVMKIRSKEESVYFGHPFQFWKSRQRKEMSSKVNVEEMKILSDVVTSNAVHLQKAVINRAEEKVREMLNQEEIELLRRKEKLRKVLMEEEIGYNAEIASKEALKECGYCRDKDTMIRDYEKQIEREKVNECQKALEREKIAKGMQCSRVDEHKLREMQKLQMQEKKYMEYEEREREKMWHQILLNDVNRKEEYERHEFRKRQQEMMERRLTYDEQIASATRKRQEAIRQEREKENKRLENMKKKMEQDHYDAIKKKKEQQITNKSNYIEGHEMKMNRLMKEKMEQRMIDNSMIRTALRELQQERQRKILEIESLQKEKRIGLESFNHERRLADHFDKESDRITLEWKSKEEIKSDAGFRNIAEEKQKKKEEAAEEYRKYLEERIATLERNRRERGEKMERVKRAAIEELKKKLKSANEELRRQIEYRNNLRSQINENQTVMENEIAELEAKQRPFTRKPHFFKDAMKNTVDSTDTKESTNPVHPFRRIIETQTNVFQLPSIGRVLK